MNEPLIIEIAERKLVGMRIKTSFAEDKTSQLWRSFRPRTKEIKTKLDARFYSVQILGESLNFENFTSQTEFEKWATVEVKDFDEIPDGMETYVLSGGKYAIFSYQGAANNFHQMTKHIFEIWLPNSEYKLDKRARFEILPDNYNPFDSNATEEIWIPIRRK